jgi:hypothetical protein
MGWRVFLFENHTAKPPARALAGLVPLLERRRIAFPKAQHARLSFAITAGIFT